MDGLDGLGVGTVVGQWVLTERGTWQNAAGKEVPFTGRVRPGPPSTAPSSRPPRRSPMDAHEGGAVVWSTSVDADPVAVEKMKDRWWWLCAKARAEL